MVTLRKVTLAALLGASLAVLALAIYLFFDYREGQYLLDNSYTATAGIDERTRALDSHVENLARHVGDAELLVMILLGTSGLYALVFVMSSFFSAVSFARQADRSIGSIRDQLSLAMSDLRELKEEARKILQTQAPPARSPGEPQQRSTGNLAAQVDTMLQQMAKWGSVGLDSQARLELLHYESAAAGLEWTGGPPLGASLAGLYRRFAEFYAASDKARQRFYLTRALTLGPADSQTASEIHYDLACWYADSRDFSHALGELTLAFQHQTKALDDLLAQDIEEGGRLYQLATTPPFEKALNDLLLNMSIGIG